VQDREQTKNAPKADFGMILPSLLLKSFRADTLSSTSQEGQVPKSGALASWPKIEAHKPKMEMKSETDKQDNLQ
jgi:hypothetical protein